MISNASDSREVDITILDQNSCPEWKSKLASWQGSGWINNIIFLGDNIGKLEGLRMLMNAVQSEIISYTDDDVLFYGGWLDKQMEVLDGIHMCHLVTGSPVLTKFKWHSGLLGWMQNHDEYDVRLGEVGKEYPMRWLEDDGLCRGIPPKEYLKIVKKDNVEPWILKYEGIEAWLVGHHMQFTAKRRIVKKYLPKPSKALMGQMREWDVKMDKEKVLQLATFERTCRHMGNVMDQQIVDDAIEMELVL